MIIRQKRQALTGDFAAIAVVADNFLPPSRPGSIAISYAAALKRQQTLNAYLAL